MSFDDLCIVKFKNGKYAIRKGFFIYRYFDFDSPDKLWWEKDDKYFADSCLISSLEAARSILKELKRLNNNNFKNNNSNFKDEEVVER